MITPKVNTKTNVQTGQIVQVFKFPQGALTYIKKNRLTNVVKTSIQTALKKARTDAAAWMREYWPIDTHHLLTNAIKYLYRHRWYNVEDALLIEIGSDVVYLRYLVDLADRMAAKGKRVNWTNARTRMIEDDIIGHTIEFYVARIKEHIANELTNVGLGWMQGKGRMPKHPVVTTQKYKREIKRYYGKKKLLRWNT